MDRLLEDIRCVARVFNLFEPFHIQPGIGIPLMVKNIYLFYCDSKDN